MLANDILILIAYVTKPPNISARGQNFGLDEFIYIRTLCMRTAKTHRSELLCSTMR